MSDRWPFLIPFLFMTVGMMLSVFSGYYGNITSVIAAFSCLLLAHIFLSSRIASVCTALFFFCWGLFVLQFWLTPELSPDSILSKTSDHPIIIEGVITMRPSVAPEGSRLTIQAERVIRGGRAEETSGSLQLFVSEGDVTLTRGDRIRFSSKISVPHRLGLPGEFDYGRFLAFQGISATARVASQNEIVLIRAAAIESWQRTIDLLARLAGDTIRRAIPDVRLSSVLAALLIGDQRRIPQDLAEAYTMAGVNHILSISGFHVGIIVAFITLLVTWFLTRFEYIALRWNIRTIAVMIAVPAMTAYLFFSGNAPATARSVIMLTVFAVALLAEREREQINTLLLAAFFLVAVNPPTLFDVSFQLSFISLWGILVAAPLISKYTAKVKSLSLRSLSQFVAASVAASSVTLLPVLFVFKVASLNGILTNFVIVPLLGYGTVLTGFIALPFAILIPSAASLLLWPAAKLIAISNQFILWCTSLPVIMYYGITSLDMCFFMLFMTSVTFIKNRILLCASVVIIPITAIVLHIYSATSTDGLLHITMLSVGQAESLLLRLPDASTLLVDGGGYLHDTGHDFGQRLLAPALWALHAGRVDRMIATHDHPDHSGGLPYIIKNFPVGEFWSVSNVAQEVGRELDKHQVKRRVLAAGDVISLPGSVRITVLSPANMLQAGADGGETSVNEQSLVFRLVYGSFSMIFCADAGFEAEERMLAGHFDLKSDVLKVGHHGSRYSTSEAFLKQVSPGLALISAGSGNRFGLPSNRIITLLQSNGIPLYRTDRDGTIELATDGVTWSVAARYRSD
jgi:competence protein ComEC